MKNVEGLAEDVDVGRMEEGEGEEGYLYPKHCQATTLALQCC